LALWTDVSNSNNINAFDDLLSDEIAFGTFVNAGSFAAANDPNNPTLAQVFDFADGVERYLRLDIKSNHGGGFVGFAEVAAETSVPEPGTLALLCRGLAGLGLSRRRRES
jgi:hypothetical protein